MENRKLIEALRATLDPNQRVQAEQQLGQIHKIIGFAPTLLQVIMMPDVEMPVRQAELNGKTNFLIYWIPKSPYYQLCVIDEFAGLTASYVKIAIV